MGRMHILTFWNFLILKLKEKGGTDFTDYLWYRQRRKKKNCNVNKGL